jgi:hypothetical protein
MAVYTVYTAVSASSLQTCITSFERWRFRYREGSSNCYHHIELGKVIHHSMNSEVHEVLLKNGIPNRHKLSVEERRDLELWVRSHTVIDFDSGIHSNARTRLNGGIFITLTENQVVELLGKCSSASAQKVKPNYQEPILLLVGVLDGQETVTLEEVRVRLRANFDALTMRRIPDPYKAMALQIWVPGTGRIVLSRQFKIKNQNTAKRDDRIACSARRQSCRSKFAPSPSWIPAC